MKVVLDTNVLVSGIFWSGPASRILELWAKDQIEVVVSPEILTEYHRLLAAMERNQPAGLADVWLCLSPNMRPSSVRQAMPPCVETPTIRSSSNVL